MLLLQKNTEKAHTPLIQIFSEFKLKTWSEYYKECKKVYGDSDVDVNDLTIHTKHFKDEKYNNLITSLRNKLDVLYQNESNYEWKNVAMGLNDIFMVEDELKPMVEEYLIPYLEENIFGCYVHCDNIKIYKTPQVNSQESSSWVWHIDNNPVEQMKVMIYINDVNKILYHLLNKKHPIKHSVFNICSKQFSFISVNNCLSIFIPNFLRSLSTRQYILFFFIIS